MMPVYRELIRFVTSRQMTFSIVLRDGVQLVNDDEVRIQAVFVFCFR